MSMPEDPAPTGAYVMRTMRANGEWWVSITDLTTALTLLEFEAASDDSKALYGPAFATVRNIIEEVVPR